MTMSEHRAEELLRPLQKLPRIEGRKKEASPGREGRRSIRLAVTIGVVGILAAGCGVAAVKQLSHGSAPSLGQEARESRRRAVQLGMLATASNAEIEAMLRAGTVPLDLVNQTTMALEDEHRYGPLRKAAREGYALFTDELRFYKGRKLLHITKCNWPHPSRACLINPIAAMESHPGADLVEIWNNGRPVAGGG